MTERRTRTGRRWPGASTRELLAALEAKPWQTRKELGGAFSFQQLNRLVRDGRVIRREGVRRFNCYEYALPDQWHDS